MYYRLFRWFPKRVFSRLLGRLASIASPRWLLQPVIRIYIAAFRIDMSQFVTPPGGHLTFNAFFTRAVRPEARPVAADEAALVCPVDGTVIERGAIARGRLLQIKGHAYSLAALLGEAPGWEAYDGGTALTVYLSPRDYHRIHSPCAGEVTRFCYIPGDLWTVGPLGVQQVPDLFARNERIVTFIRTAFGEVALVAVGATIVGSVKVVYHPHTTNRPGASAFSAELQPPYPLTRGAELGWFELGSTVILLGRPGEVTLHVLQPGDPIRMGEAIGTILTGSAQDGAGDA